MIYHSPDNRPDSTLSHEATVLPASPMDTHKCAECRVPHPSTTGTVGQRAQGWSGQHQAGASNEADSPGGGQAVQMQCVT